jgi:hypothetical protein
MLYLKQILKFIMKWDSIPKETYHRNIFVVF